MFSGGMQAQTSDNDGFATGVAIPPLGLPGFLRVPQECRGLVVFAHGSGSNLSSPRNAYVAEGLNRAGFATLLFDLLRDEEEADRRNVFDIPLLADRLAAAIDWRAAQDRLAHLPLGLFGASTGAAAALVVAARFGSAVAAVVSRGGRPDLAKKALETIRAPTLLIVGGHDREVLLLNEAALSRLNCPKALKVIPGATHLFSEPGALDGVVAEAAGWFSTYLK
ncbi:MAG: dienelactone hydrolase family protein [Mesorhizobium sp.]|uniref:dienelactone hydrolase family protein n=1 Tax=Mesorhizobium sp. TaxID=1871066 RepID=UPI00122A482F|nr:alpha/beta family hydrolase [Mesorhizobium sp.]TIO50136.1 MAG: dienelactone hydrolase family protein [Mesorhizobium sp.]TIO57274.1 MAG: dienelactone hydrolase family protein [Mesorhizobium sp.]TJV61816.1 MAG: dienelactone hydrolase family protein [Mesorhizobium sp.]